MSTSISHPARRRVFNILLLGIFGGMIFLSLAIPYIGQVSQKQLRVGDVANQDYLAPYTLTLESAILTDRQRDAAEKTVQPIYSLPNTNIARQQLENLRAALAYITNIRSDAYASHDQKVNDLAALENVLISLDTATYLLTLSDSRWQIVQQEAIRVLEQLLRNTVREDQLENALRSVPNLISLSLPEDQALIVTELVTSFTTPNSFYDEDLTLAAREQARAEVQPVPRTYVANQNIVQQGQVITEVDLEALQAFDLALPQTRWQDFAAMFSLTLVVCALTVIYLRRNPYTRGSEQDMRSLLILMLLFLTFLLIARLIIPGHVVIPYLYPLMAYSMIVALLYRDKLSLVSTLPLAVLVSYGLPNALELAIYYTLGGYFGILALGRAQRFSSFIRAGLAITLSGIAVILAFHLPQSSTDWIGLGTLASAALVCSIAAAGISLMLDYFLAQFLGMTTALQLTELSRPDHPLMQFILRNAAGTYQHSLQLANLAEQAAEQINADPLLTRVGALYHDCGKAINPIFFIENQIPGSPNPHDDLSPAASTEIILRHVSDGLALGQRYHLPRRILDFIKEHHGTMITHYQYVLAVEAAGGDESQVDPNAFRYPGPRPRSRETALLLLADGSEARLRAERPGTEDEIRQLIQEVVQSRLEMGQLNDTDLTLRDLESIVNSFTTTLRGVFHPRLQYPKLSPPAGAQNRPLPAGSTDPIPLSTLDQSHDLHTDR